MVTSTATATTAATVITTMESYGRWECVTDDPPWAARDGAGAVTFRGRMWLMGGWNHTDPVLFPDANGQTSSEVWSSADGASWTLEVAEAPWPSRHCSGFLVHDDAIWLVGGDNGRGPYQKDVWRSSNGVEWELVSAATVCPSHLATRSSDAPTAAANRCWPRGRGRTGRST